MSSPTNFTAAVLLSPKARHTIQTRSLPELKPGEVGIKIDATAINPVDWKMRDYDLFLPGYPTILGSDASGTIVSLGSSVANFSIGDRVFFQGILGTPQSSTFQQYCVMPSSLIAPIPSNTSFEAAAGVSLATMAVAIAFYHTIGYGMAPPWSTGGSEVGKGKAVVILGGASSVGQYAVQLARLSGFEKIVTNSGSENIEMVEKLGADVVLNRTISGVKEFADAVGDTELAFVFDAISAPATQRLGVEILQEAKKRSEDACLVTLHTVHPDHPDMEAVKLGREGEVKVDIRQVLGLGSQKDLRYLSEPLMKALGGNEGWIAKGKFVPNRVRVVEGGLTKVDDALDLNKAGVSGVKVVIRPWDT
ncbi:putative alcohol dehydrogenase [Cadophora sp. MPI-SDFR-AT-0126]|nr:putative alcohol dehydrogenase [Leotiomycetes sp. MPI-SDFR-AT-0126]